MIRRNRGNLLRSVLLFIFLFFPAAAMGQKSAQTVKVSGSLLWTDTKIDVQAGERIWITGSGTVQYPAPPSDGSRTAGPQSTGPEGLARGWKDLLRIYPVPDGNRGALIGRIGDSDAAQPFLIGASKELVVPIGGRLFLGINQQKSDQAQGSYEAKVEIILTPKSTQAGVGAIAGMDSSELSITADVLNTIPRRIVDKDGNPGDMVNFLILGSEQNMKQTFQTAGWVQVDKTKTDAVLHGLVSTLSKQAYLEKPMSVLYLFGRPQDYGFAHAEPISVVASRNHLRIWKAPFDVNGETLWVGAATHDIGFERDQRNNGVTHKIDPDIDNEREYVGETLNDVGLITQLTHVTPPYPLTEAKTATGGSFHSDGKILVMALRNSGAGKTPGATSSPKPER